MKQVRSTRVLTLAVAGVAVTGALAMPAVAAAEPLHGGTGISQWGEPGLPGGPGAGGPGAGGPGLGAPAPAPAPVGWGGGWNNGPQQSGWCGGPIRDLLHPICWLQPH